MLTLIRGVSGSGKSTLAKKLKGDDVICDHFEADMYFINERGEYKFIPYKIKFAHEWCQNSARQALKSGRDVIVSNTMLTVWEIEPYMKMARDLQVPLRVIQCKVIFGNVHGVPESKIEEMKQKFVPNSALQDIFHDVVFDSYDSIEF